MKIKPKNVTFLFSAILFADNRKNVFSVDSHEWIPFFSVQYNDIDKIRKCKVFIFRGILEW